jgi:hypothetical protein
MKQERGQVKTEERKDVPMKAISSAREKERARGTTDPT